LAETFEPSRRSRFALPRSGLEVGTPEQFRWLRGIVKCLLVLNLLDALFTLLWVRAGLAREANALLDTLVNENALLFVGTKIALVSLGSFLLWRWRHRPIATIGLFVAFIVYYWILVYHIGYASLLIGGLIWR